MNTAIEFLRRQIGETAIKSPSPLMRWMNPILLEASEGTLSFQYTIKNEWLNPMGKLHGGIIAAIVDDTIGATVFSFGEPHFYATINNTIDYFGTIQAGEMIIAKTVVLKKGKQLINAQCEIWNTQNNRLIAKGYSNLLKTDVEK
ncbi:MAG: PaaI family thioesterase [Chitinophagaceae bacterium]|nr:PaaI family thioesterase [Chitinophagaceae bacterium]